jgi:metal-responsive CopG/Arc/MetJ family transcriptional regulator
MISLRLPKEIVAKLNEIAKKEKKTRTETIKEAIYYYFEKKKIKLPPPPKSQTPPKAKKKS